MELADSCVVRNKGNLCSIGGEIEIINVRIEVSEKKSQLIAAKIEIGKAPKLGSFVRDDVQAPAVSAKYGLAVRNLFNIVLGSDQSFISGFSIDDPDIGLVDRNVFAEQYAAAPVT